MPNPLLVRPIGEIRGKLEALVMYYLHNRGAGHTNALMIGAKGSHDGLILTHAYAYSQELVSECYTRFGKRHGGVGLDSIEQLMARTGPLMVDNSAIGLLCNQAAQAIATLERENRDLRSSLDQISLSGRGVSNEIAGLHAEIHRLRQGMAGTRVDKLPWPFEE